jgi:hypothetical protein
MQVQEAHRPEPSVAFSYFGVQNFHAVAPRRLNGERAGEGISVLRTLTGQAHHWVVGPVNDA